MYAFDYHRPASLDEVKSLLGKFDDPKILAGGHTLLPTMKLRLAMPTDLIDIGHLTELKGIEVSGNALTFKFATASGVKLCSSALSTSLKRRTPGAAPVIAARTPLGPSETNTPTMA